MKRTICNKEYDTEAARLILKNAVGGYGEPTGYEEALYQTADGSYFLYTNGGSNSPYREERITRLSKKSAEAWLAERT